MKRRYWGAAAVAAVIGGLYLLNASWLAEPPAMQPLLQAHRGDYQRYDRSHLTNDTCTATRIFKPTNDYLENTLPSMAKAFQAGADVVEIDVHPTTDHQFAVFHDWTLDCRTDGHGTTREHTMAELKALDIGYGYTYDGGKTFPFRGRFKGAMPSLEEVLKAFPGKRILINIKSNDPAEADALDAYLNRIGEARDPRLSVYGGDKPIARLEVTRPEMRPFSVASLKACGYSYIALGWTGFMPKACHDTTIYLPVNMTWMLWGYPNRLQARFAAAGSYIYLLGAQKGSTGLQGLDSTADLARVPASWRMGILTDEIETTGPWLKARTSRARPNPHLEE